MPGLPSVLVVDDEEQSLEMMREYLMSWGFQVISARTPKEALVLLRNKPVDAVVSDYDLPETNREKSTWYKIRNRGYSQMQGREELFEHDRHREPVAGWHSCALACEESSATTG